MKFDLKKVNELIKFTLQHDAMMYRHLTAIS